MTRDQLQAVEKEGLGKWLGRRSDMAYLLRHATIFCLPTSYRERLPRVLVEASAARRPIITTDTPGCRDVVKDGVNGTLIPPENIPALVDALGKLLID